jgi:hypothetical protein
LLAVIEKRGVADRIGWQGEPPHWTCFLAAKLSYIASLVAEYRGFELVQRAS